MGSLTDGMTDGVTDCPKGGTEIALHTIRRLKKKKSRLYYMYCYYLYGEID